MVAGYTIEDVLGQGGMGTVYRARNPSLPRSDALKVLSAELSADDQFRRRFEREAELAATLDHPNIVTVYARGEADAQLWIAMQLVAGSDADKELREGRMTPQRAVAIVGEVAKALDYAHRRNLLHRDVKPANFLLGPDDERIFLADFGIARALDEAVHLTQTGMVMASVAYASPESLTGEAVDWGTDIYSLGCSLFRMLTQKAPFARSGGMAGMAAAHLSQPPPRVTELMPALPRAINDVIAKAMAKNPAERYQSARELAAAAAAALDETTAEVRTAPTPPLTAPWQIGAPPQHFTPPHGPPTGSGQIAYPGGAFSGPTGTYSGPSGGYPGPGSGFSGPPRAGAPPFDPTPPGGRLPYFGGPSGEPAREPAPPPPAPRSRRRLWIAAGVAAVLVAAAATVGVVAWGGDSPPAYQPQTLAHANGSTEIKTQPHAVAALGPGDAQAVLSLGVQPVVAVAPAGVLPSWEQQLVTGDVRVLPSLDNGAIAAAKPDVIIDTGVVDGATYSKLGVIAPTVTRPASASAWTWQDQLTWMGRILGRSDKAQQLIDTAASQQAQLRSQNPAFDGKTIEVVNVSDAGITVSLTDSAVAAYLEGLGFRYSDQFKPAAGETADTRPVPDPEALNTAATDVRIVVRTDAAAGAGSYNGLPKPFSTYRGATIIVDDPTVISALSDGGYAATEYLNGTLADALARQVH
jgi:serine/threonine-protein kinase